MEEARDGWGFRVKVVPPEMRDLVDQAIKANQERQAMSVPQWVDSIVDSFVEPIDEGGPR